MTDQLRTEYRALYERVLVPTAAQLEAVLKEHFTKADRIDRIAARAKDIDRFVIKAAKVDAGGRPRYERPLLQIQDLVGARIVVYYKNDLRPAEELVMKYLRPIESKTIVPDSEWKFGYFGRHFIMRLPGEAVPRDIDVKDAPQFFELQIKTLFQHAWSEAEHDLGYKAPEELNDEQQRSLAYTSAQAWGADEVFERLVGELVAP